MRLCITIPDPIPKHFTHKKIHDTPPGGGGGGCFKTRRHSRRVLYRKMRHPGGGLKMAKKASRNI